MVGVALPGQLDEAEHLADVTEGFGDFGRVSPALLIERIAVPDLGERSDRVVKDDRCGGTITMCAPVRRRSVRCSRRTALAGSTVEAEASGS